MKQLNHRIFLILLAMLLPASYVLSQETVFTASPGAFRCKDGMIYFTDPVLSDKNKIYLVEYQTGKRVLLERGQIATSYINQSLGFSLEQLGTDWVLTRIKGKRVEKIMKAPFKEKTIYFKSGNIHLFGKLVVPEGNGKFPVVIIAHGSDNESAVDTYFEPYLFASQGIACFVYDKRGTGKSEGQAILSFQLLSDDMVAAISQLHTFQSVDTSNIGLSGYSQGGWIAPLAALKSGQVKFAVINYGMAMSVADEDQYEAPLKLADKGIKESAITEFKELNNTIHRIVKNDFQTGWVDTLKVVYNKYAGRPWMDSLKKTLTWAGSLAKMGWEQVSKYVPDLMRTLDPFYDPVTTLSKLNIPMLWLVGDADIEAPPQITIKLINNMIQEGKKPFELKIYRHADHGLLLFTKAGTGAKRVYTDYAPGYFIDVVRWIKKQIRK